MKLRKSRVLREVRNNQLSSCAKINLGDPRVVEICGMLGYSSVWLCMEHVPNDWSVIENSIRAAKVHDMDVIVRVARGSYSDYIRPLECDATGVMIPHVSSADEAREIVSMCRFRPFGNRALDGGNVDGAFCDADLDAYLDHANTERYIILQIESPEAVEQIDEIAAVPGYDCLLFGPGDFTHRLGKPGQFDCPEVLEARAKVEEAARRNGKFSMAVGLNLDAASLLARGYGIVNLGSDVYGLGTYLKNQLKGYEAIEASVEAASLYSS